MTRVANLLTLVVCTMLLTSQQAAATEVKVLASDEMKPILSELGPEFAKQGGNSMSVDSDNMHAVIKKIEGGTAFDVAILTQSAFEQLFQKQLLAADGLRVIARAGLGVIVKEGAAKPDISSPEALKKALQDAKSITYSDPSTEGSSGILVVRVIQRLGLADAVKAKTKLKKGGSVAEMVASGEAEIGIQMLNDVVGEKGVTLVGPLPPNAQNYTVYFAAVSAKASSADAAKAVTSFLSGPQAAPVFTAHGMEPPPAQSAKPVQPEKAAKPAESAKPVEPAQPAK